MNIWENIEMREGVKAIERLICTENHVPVRIVCSYPSVRDGLSRYIAQNHPTLVGDMPFSKDDWLRGRSTNKKVFEIILLREAWGDIDAERKGTICHNRSVVLRNSAMINLQRLAAEVLRARTGLRVGLLA